MGNKLKTHIDIPYGASLIMNLLNRAGYKAYIVGGCVRDVFMHRSPKDWDICTSAKPDEVEAALTGMKIIKTGIKHGTVTIIVGNDAFEVTTFRIDGEYKNNRKPESVSFVSDINEDLARRDFTMNAIAYNHQDGFVDPYGGIADIDKRIVRCVRNSEKRFEEDALRIMRCLRFASVFGFCVESRTKDELLRNLYLLENISRERVRDEFNKLLLGDSVGVILREYREVFASIIPEIIPMFDLDQENNFHVYDVWEHTISVIEKLPQNLTLRLAGFFHDSGKPSCKFIENGVGHFYGHERTSARIASSVLKRFRYDNLTIEHVVDVVKNHSIVFAPRTRQPLRLLNKMGEEKLKLLIELELADVKSQNPAFAWERTENILTFKSELVEILETAACFSLKDLDVNGYDLMKLGIPRGRMVGEILDKLLSQVLEGNLENDKDSLIATAIEVFNRKAQK